ncbi:alpha/beta fold hydrolase [Streptomyces sp. NPDC088387]|uniref:alpha/beta fold hydrolase n=1 Tax=Streptomyces sp. NPDC088387 TaxID=3365859 RepID=UPI0038198BBF
MSLSTKAPGLVLATALLLTVTACTNDTESTAAPHPESASPSADLDSFYSQKLSFGACADYATTKADEKIFAAPGLECARLKVPLDYAEPHGPSGEVALLRVPARGRAKGSLVLNPGGPGGPGMSFAAVTAKALAKSPLTEHFDLVGFDPRGVGATKPAISCFTDEEYLAGDTQTEFLLAAGTYTEKDSRALTDKCAKASGGPKNLAAVSSRDSVRDTDILRAALGDDKLSFLGQSYGTRIGALYAEAFPQNVRALVLDGAVDPRLGSERRLSQYAGFQRSFDVMAANCATQKDCPLGDDPKKATQEFHKIARPLLDRPVPYGEGQEFTYNDLIGGVIVALYSKESWPVITKGLTELRAGRPDRFVKASQLFAGREPDGGGSNYDVANFAINCMDEARLTPEQAARFRSKAYTMLPFADPGRGSDGAQDACASWPAEPKTTYPFSDRVEGLPSTLTISITGDPSTPFDAGVRLARTLGGSMLKVNGEQHTIAASGTNACVNTAVADYLITLHTPDPDTECTI